MTPQEIIPPASDGSMLINGWSQVSYEEVQKLSRNMSNAFMLGYKPKKILDYMDEHVQTVNWIRNLAK